MIQEGADILDVGGESTRPGAAAVSPAEEIKRVIPIIKSLRKKTDIAISVDTSKPEVADEALRAGADIVNDVTGFRDKAMIQICADSNCGMVAMHMQGNPMTMQQAPQYQDVVLEVHEFLLRKHNELVEEGIDPERLVFDPGIGFGKSLKHNLSLLKNLGDLKVKDRPLLLGLSRKSMIGALVDENDPAARSWPTVALTALGRIQGAAIHRVHEVQSNREALQMAESLH